MEERTRIEESVSEQLCGFTVGETFYAIPVLEVQEVIKPQKLTPIPLSGPHIKGLINLRGQIVTSISLRQLFGIEGESNEHMNVIVKAEDSLYALVVDEIRDVIEVEHGLRERTPDTIHPKIKKYISSVYKLNNQLLVLLDLKQIFKDKEKGDEQ